VVNRRLAVPSNQKIFVTQVSVSARLCNGCVTEAGGVGDGEGLVRGAAS
jgi:hypothetical protein